MGTWGITIFEDDTALEFYDNYCQLSQSVQDLKDAFEVVLATDYDTDKLLEAFLEPVRALVYAEIIAKVLGKPVETFPSEDYHRDWDLQKIDFDKISKHLNDDLLQKAIDAVHKIKTDNHIHYTLLWVESDYYDEWQAYLDDLITRLSFS